MGSVDNMTISVISNVLIEESQSGGESDADYKIASQRRDDVIIYLLIVVIFCVICSFHIWYRVCRQKQGNSAHALNNMQPAALDVAHGTVDCNVTEMIATGGIQSVEIKQGTGTENVTETGGAAEIIYEDEVDEV